jgi:hypothetical protein
MVAKGGSILPSISASTLKSESSFKNLNPESSFFSQKSGVLTGCEPCLGDTGCLDWTEEEEDGISAELL